MTPRVLVTGATGLVEQAVIEQLTAAGIPVRDFPTATESLDAALAGIDSVLLTPAGPPDPELFARLVGAGVRRIVLLSSSSAPWERRAPRAQRHFLAWEHAVEATGLERTHLRPVGLMAHALRWADGIRRQRLVHEGFAAARHPYIHEQDVAAVAVAALVEDGHAGARYLLTGPAAIDIPEQIRALADALGEPVRFEELDEEDAVAQWRAQGYDQDSIDIELITRRDLVDKPASPRRTVERLLGRPALPFSRWAADHVEAFR